MLAEDDWRYYGYNPSYTMAIVVSALFGVVGLVHLGFMIRLKSWRLVRRRERLES